MTDKSFNNAAAMSDNALAKQIGSFVRHHRLAQNQTQDNLAHASGISRSTLSLLERGEAVTLATFIQVLRVLDQLQIMDVFAIDKSISPLAIVKKQKEERQRASGTPPKTNKKAIGKTWMQQR